MAEAARLSADTLPGAHSLCLRVECEDGRDYRPVAPWRGDLCEALEVARAFCARWALRPVRVSPMVSYDAGQLPYLVLADLAVTPAA